MMPALHGRVTVTELPSDVIMRNRHGERVYPIDLIHAAFHDAVCRCAIERENSDSRIDPGLLEDLAHHARDGEEMIEAYKACQLKAALGIPPEEW